MKIVTDIFAAIIKPITDLLAKKQERKMARETAQAKITSARDTNATSVEMKDQEWEAIAVSMTKESWKDEYATVSVLSLLNLIVLGGILAAFGYPQVITGIQIAVQGLTLLGVDIGWLMELVVMAAVGLHIYRKI